MEAKAIVFSRPNGVRLHRFEMRNPGRGEILIETAYSCISVGTELRRLRGKEAIRPISYPFIPGYSLAGHVIACGPDAGIEEGTPVVTNRTVYSEGLGAGAHLSHAVAPVEGIVPVPEQVELLDASAAILSGIAYHGLRQSRPLAGERVAVLGLGMIGQLSARLHAASGGLVVGCDLSEHRVSVCRTTGINAVEPRPSLKDAFAPFFPTGADIIVDATGVPEVIPKALELAHRAPYSPLFDNPPVRYLIEGSYEGMFSIPYAAAYEAQLEILIPKGSQVSDWHAALELLSWKKLRIRDLISDVREPESAAKTYAELSDPQTELITVAFGWK